MKFYLLINKIMTKKSGIFKAVAVATALVVSPAGAETHNQIEQQKIEQKVEKVTCATKLACDVLSNSIQAQIDELNVKIASSTGKEKRKLYRERQALKQEKTSTLIASKDAEISVENSKQVKQKETIAEEQAETQAKLAKVSARLDSIEGSL